MEGKDLDKGKSKMEETTDGQSQNPEPFPCFFCEAKFPFMKLYLMHVKENHPQDLHPGYFQRLAPDATQDSPILESFSCYYCRAILFSAGNYLVHLKKKHSNKSWAEKDDQETKSEEDWRAYINKSEDEDDEEESVDDKVVKQKKTDDKASKQDSKSIGV